MHTINPDLINDLAERRAAIFIGAGVSAGVTTLAGTRIKVWGQFLLDASESLTDPKLKKQTKDLIKQQDYLMACEMISRGLGTAAWEKLLEEEYHQRGTPSELQKLIINLNQRLIITTNFDLYLEAAWEEANKNATHHLKTVKTITEKAFQAFRDSQSYLFKIHGSIDDIPSMIFTKKDYSDKAYGNWAYSKFMETVLLTHTVLFIGFSLGDPAIAQIIENYAHNMPNARPHYIFLAGNQSDKFIEINKDLRKIYIMPYDKRNNHQELTEIFKQISADVDVRRREISIKAIKQNTPEEKSAEIV
ncbi:SIR2 family protein [Pseudomonas sp. PDM20]|uniref:SIR2 family protein n=1 Tax=Pseudomonas sp. PDM20 TaxID=2769254 RepID=UPI001780074A|nr:SIR2 family protein [Pseudomonas sp. PDM20]MBD9682889.1 SIR2 family protein [Pseudomonas sp. PDM20]